MNDCILHTFQCFKCLSDNMLTSLRQYLHSYIIRNQIHLCIFTYAAVWTGGEVQLSKEHDGFLWLHKDEVEESELPHWMKRDIFRALEAVENH